MVVGVQNLMTKTGKPWGKFKLEDYNGGHEFALFGKDYENFRKYLFPDYFLFVRGRVQAKHSFISALLGKEDSSPLPLSNRQ